MKMTALEKRYVNRERKGYANIERVRLRLAALETSGLRRALEVGCGTGAVSAFLAREYGMDATGIDADPEQIALARSAHGESDGVRFEVADVTTLAWDDATFDLVVCQNVFHHIPAWQRAAREIGRVLRRSGYLLWLDIVVPALVKPFLRPLAGRVGVYTANDALGVFEACGLEERFGERLVHGPVVHRHAVLQKVG